ncbi:hypothetical protein H7691_08475 [Stenotrophomonas sp. CW117]|uniref:hypothetical protein n=1 Tax=Stenotrophomonas TaxID=40323 RepID=UPI000702ACBA|nr:MULTISPECIES: hypothetical protein [Stenotrophomonas]KRG84308.1 hypothetical protein ABB33_11835 [Stenotrophomonas acidaminiphila]QOG00123.1 hypothetical protein H7691_08475 [Stenotrophomonas sp. CW117]
MTNFLKAYCLMTYLERHPTAEASMSARIRVADLVFSKTDEAIERHGVDDWEKILRVVHKAVLPLARYDLETDRLWTGQSSVDTQSPLCA